jgi:replication factor C small subunit
MVKIKIKSIKKLDKKHHVYDLSVDGNHNFFIGENVQTLTSNCDYLSLNSQAALRNMMEMFSATTRFILTCNYHEKMLPAIVSRCQTYQINPISKKEVAVHLTKILDNENVQYISTDLGYIVNTYYPDIRKIINYTQQSVIDGKIQIAKNNTIDIGAHEKIVSMLKTGIGKPTTFNEIRQLVADADITQFDECFEFLYKNVDAYAFGRQAIATLVIAEHSYQCAILPNTLKEVSFMACISKMLTELKK